MRFQIQQRSLLIPLRSAVEEEVDTPEAVSKKSTASKKSNGKSGPTKNKPQTTTSTQNAYDAGQITVLSGLDPVRKRPGMYIGSTGPDGLHHLVWEVVDNSVDEALAGHATYITTTINADGSCTVVDDGRGIPTDLHPTTGISALETVLTVLHAGGKFDNQGGSGGYKVSGGLHGVGISVVNALSSHVDVTVSRKSKNHRMRFEGGASTGLLEITDIPKNNNDKDEEDASVVDDSIVQEMDRLKAKQSTSDDDDKNDLKEQIQKLEILQSLQKKRNTGTAVTFLPDVSVFKGENGEPDITFDTSRLSSRMDEIAYLNAGLLLTLQDKRERTTTKKKSSDSSSSKSRNRFQVFYHAGGLAEYAELLCRTKTPLLQSSKGGKKSTTKSNKADPMGGYLSEDGATILCSGETAASNDGSPPVAISVALRWSSDMYTESILSFCNNIRTRDGGSHVDGLKTSLTRTINQVVKRYGKAKEGASNLPGEFIREGLTAIISVSVAEPEFEGQTKGRLGMCDYPSSFGLDNPRNVLYYFWFVMLISNFLFLFLQQAIPRFVLRSIHCFPPS